MRKTVLLDVAGNLVPTLNEIADVTAMAAETADNLAALTVDNTKADMRDYLRDAEIILRDLYEMTEQIEAVLVDVHSACERSPKLAEACNYEATGC